MWPSVWRGALAATSSNAWTTLAGASVAPRLSFFTYGVHGGCLAGAILVLSAEIYAGCVMNVDKKNCILEGKE